MIDDLKILIHDYFDWLKNRTHLIKNEDSDYIAIATPFTGIFNDGIEIYCKRQNGNWLLSDGGDTLTLLEESGVNLTKSKKRYEILDNILKNYGLHFENHEITVTATKDNFNQKKHNLLQALLELHELEHLSEQNVKSYFKEDVDNYFRENRILAAKDIKLTGYNGLDYHFDFQIPKFDKEFVVKTTGSLKKNTISTFVHAWTNVKQLREKNTRKTLDAAVIINDMEKQVKKELMEALQIEGVKPLLWSKKEEILETLI
jgi:hypothetical protein